MTPPGHEAGAVRLSDAELEVCLSGPPRRARRALHDVGLGGQDAC
jgi:hypothetical protein